MIMPQISCCLSRIDDWAFDMFELDELTQHRPLSTLAFALLHRSGIIGGLRLEENKLAR